MPHLRTLFFLGWLCALPAVAQTEQGNLLLGGTGSARFGDPFGVSINPNIGFFVIDQLAVGGRLVASITSSDFERNSIIGVEPFARYYFGETRTRPFALGRVGISRAQNNFLGQEQVNSAVAGGVGIGLAHFLSRQIALEGVLSYDVSVVEGDSDGGLNLNFGFQIYLDRQRAE